MKSHPSLSVTYDKCLRLDTWHVPGVTGWKYSYGDFSENTGRVTYAQNPYDSGVNGADPTLDRSYDYDSVGRLLNSYTGKEAKAHTGRQGGAWGVHDGPYSQAYLKYGGYSLSNAYDGDRLRVKKTENGVVTYYLRSRVLGGKAVAEIGSTGGWQRGYVYGAGAGCSRCRRTGYCAGCIRTRR